VPIAALCRPRFSATASNNSIHPVSFKPSFFIGVPLLFINLPGKMALLGGDVFYIGFGLDKKDNAGV